MSILELAKEGDLFIKAGKGKTVSPVLRVQSAFMKEASPVFQAMLNTNFREARTTYTAQKPLSLPEDHGKAFAELCAILHHKPSRTPDYRLLVEMTATADKYQCLDAVRPYVLMALHPYHEKRVVENDTRLSSRGLIRRDAMGIAYVLGDAQLFWRTSASVIVNNKIGGTGGRAHKGLMDLVPSSVMSK